jgi:hypothetical protein
MSAPNLKDKIGGHTVLCSTDEVCTIVKNLCRRSKPFLSMMIKCSHLMNHRLQVSVMKFWITIIFYVEPTSRLGSSWSMLNVRVKETRFKSRKILGNNMLPLFILRL